MKRNLLLFGFLLAACGSEKGVQIAKPTTFVHYFGGGYDDLAVVVKQTPDNGFIILSAGNNIQGRHNPYGAKVIKTDIYGNQEWEKVFFQTSGAGSNVDTGKDLLVLKDGYLLLGERNIIQLASDGTTKAQNDPSISTKTSNTPSYPNINNDVYSTITIDQTGEKLQTGVIKGANITAKPDFSSYWVTGLSASYSDYINDSTFVPRDLYIGELSADFKFIWIRKIASAYSVNNQLFLDNKSSATAYWSGLFLNNTSNAKMTVYQAPKNSPVTSSPSIGSVTGNQKPYNLARFGNGFLLTGTTTEKDNSNNTDICYYMLSENLSLLGSQVEVDLSQADPSKNITSKAGSGQVIFKLPNSSEIGRAISSTQDGGVILLGQIDANYIPNYTNKSNKSEYMLIKTDGFGNLASGWPKYYGSKDQDVGASIIQANDGSFVVLGTTVLGGTQTLMLMKTDKDGNIQ